MKLERITPAALILALGLTIAPTLVHAGDGPPPSPEPPHSVERPVQM